MTPKMWTPVISSENVALRITYVYTLLDDLTDHMEDFGRTHSQSQHQNLSFCISGPLDSLRCPYHSQDHHEQRGQDQDQQEWAVSSLHIDLGQLKWDIRGYVCMSIATRELIGFRRSFY